ncbi:MAG: radical SAM protein [Parvibaculum sp.]|uniref:radical SAM protein n=1 Tax=Parvibaculum sp. TaxID=2024848 RepID=UPI00271BC83D|nr:radical SAM protein [Parvibaculum sp.]MDO8839023.1 radical SAM protein [Parvibaculum sp.]
MTDATPIKFSHPDITARGEARAHVSFQGLKTLWINTGTLCNIECANCYIHSSPTDDRLVYLTASEASHVFDMVGHDAIEIGFTGGEPFMNPDMLSMMHDALGRGHSVLVLTNAMQPMQRPGIKSGLLDIKARYGERMTLRVSLDHHTEALHDAERGVGGFAKTMEGLRWLAGDGFSLAIAGRSIPGETEEQARSGYAALFAREGVHLDTADRSALVIFPEMDEKADVPEITTACWDILHVDPAEMMCATSRMVVKRKGAAKPVFVACTLLPDDPQFEMGETLAESLTPVKLNHRHCAKFCVLGGASCSAG